MESRTLKEIAKSYGKQRKQKSTLWSKLLKEGAKGLTKKQGLKK